MQSWSDGEHSVKQGLRRWKPVGRRYVGTLSYRDKYSISLVQLIGTIRSLVRPEDLPAVEKESEGEFLFNYW